MNVKIKLSAKAFLYIAILLENDEKAISYIINRLKENGYPYENSVEYYKILADDENGEQEEYNKFYSQVSNGNYFTDDDVDKYSEIVSTFN